MVHAHLLIAFKATTHFCLVSVHAINDMTCVVVNVDMIGVNTPREIMPFEIQLHPYCQMIRSALNASIARSRSLEEPIDKSKCVPRAFCDCVLLLHLQQRSL